VDPDFMAATFHDVRNHLGMQHGAHGGDIKRRWNLLLIEKCEDTGQTGGSSVFAL
jgi:hypothetical protein